MRPKRHPILISAITLMVAFVPAVSFGDGYVNNCGTYCPPIYHAPPVRVEYRDRIVTKEVKVPQIVERKVEVEKPVHHYHETKVVEKAGEPVTINQDVKIELKQEQEQAQKLGFGEMWEKAHRNMMELNMLQAMGDKVAKYKEPQAAPAPPQAAPAPPVQQPEPEYFQQNAAAAYPVTATQFATFQQQFQPKYHTILDRGIRASENGASLNTQALQTAITGAIEISKLEQSIAQAEVRVKEINAQAHLLAVARDRQSLSTFQNSPLQAVQQGGLGATHGPVAPDVQQAAPAPNYGDGSLSAPGPQAAANNYSLENCAVCHNAQRNEGGLDLTNATFEQLQKAQKRILDGSMPPESEGVQLSDANKQDLIFRLGQVSQ